REILGTCSVAQGVEDLRLEARVAPSAPPRASLDSFRIVQAVANLVENAVKFTPKGGRVEIEVAGRDEIEIAGQEETEAGGEGGVLCISVSDTGVGIAPENIDHLFDRFWQGKRTDRRGAGLGLNIVRGIAEAHGGCVKVESRLHQGTRFTLELPL
ncbi:MAG TPA: ATP-binding protein, partial [Myxococcota bacterium]|nr:ATP-binding protein [Myxococcota bacterium]